MGPDWIVEAAAAIAADVRIQNVANRFTVEKMVPQKDTGPARRFCRDRKFD